MEAARLRELSGQMLEVGSQTWEAESMATDHTRPRLKYFLDLRYPFDVLDDPDGGYVIVFPDLSGCLTQADDLEEINAMAEEARRLWIETEYDLGADIPLPTQRDN